MTVGVVTFDNVWMKYAPKAPYALREVTFTIQGAEKVGVVGRTGSGKSTLLLALYRMFNLDLGRILIDNVDIASLTLLKLRRSLSIIPQVRVPPCNSTFPCESTLHFHLRTSTSFAHPPTFSTSLPIHLHLQFFAFPVPFVATSPTLCIFIFFRFQCPFTLHLAGSRNSGFYYNFF